MAGDFGVSGATRGRGADGPRPPIRGAPGYGLAVAAVAVATLVRAALDPLLGEASPYVTYFATALALFLAAGLGPAVLGAGAGGLAGAYLFVEPRGTFEATKSGATGLVLYLGVVFATLWVVRSLRDARATAERRQAELLAAEAAVRAQRETWRATLASIAEAVVATDRDGRVTFLNGVAERLLGRELAGALGQPLAEVLPLPGVGDEVLDQALRRGEVFDPEGPLDLNRGGSGATPVEVVASPIRGDGAGEVLGVVVVLRDVSAARQGRGRAGRGQGGRRGRQPRQGPLPRGPGTRAPHAADPRAARRLLHAGGDRGPGALRPILEMIRRNIEAEARLIDDLLDVVQIQRGALVGMPRTADAHALIRRAVADCRAALDAAGVEPTLDLEADPHHIWADPDRFRQSIANLLRNAAKFSPGGGRVAVQTRSEPGSTPRLVVEVTDAGVGLAPEALAMLFQPFDLSRRDPMTGGAGGLGLGLAICRAIVAGAGGTIAASSPGLGLGATFTLTFAALSAPSAASEEVPALSFDGVAAQGPLRILVVDDDAPTRRALSSALASLGHEVTTADSVASASDAIRSEFDVLLCDIGLPDGTGYDVLRLIDSPPVRAIALSGFGLDDDLRRSRASGFAEHLTKPVDLRTLEAAIRRAATP